MAPEGATAAPFLGQVAGPRAADGMVTDMCLLSYRPHVRGSRW